MSKQESDATVEFLLGAEAIRDELAQLGLIDADANLDKVYYIAKEGKLGKAIGKFGKNLISTRTKLRNAVNALVS